MRYTIAILTIVLANLLTAQDYGDAPASYGLAGTNGSSNYVTLGTSLSVDSTNPVTPAWTGDADDGIVGTPLWNSWSSFNELTVHIEDDGYLYMYVDADDSGTFEQSELYTYCKDRLVAGPSDLTFKGIKLNKLGGYSLNGVNKVAVRIMYMNPLGMLPQYRPDYFTLMGEVEDWLIDVTPPSLTVSHDMLSDAEVSQVYDTALQAIYGSGPYSWSLTAGTMPNGLSIVQIGDNFELTGTPGVGSAGVYPFEVQVTDGSSVAVQSLELRVLPSPYALPFTDDFSADKHWTTGFEWSIGPATGFVGSGTSTMGYPAVEPTTDFTTANGDDRVLMSSENSEEPDRPWADYATSAKIDCSGVNNVQLEYRRWYSIWGGKDFTTIEVTSDGQTWEEIWMPPITVPNSNSQYHSPIADVTWSKIQIDITQWAANKPWIRIRWRLGVSSHYLGTHSGYCGWAIDDVVVRETPMSGSLSAHNFEISSPGSFQDPISMLWYPVVYVGSSHDWTVEVDNPTSEAITIDAIDVNIKLDVPPGSSHWFYGAPYSVHIDCCYDWGVWTLNQPVTIPANTSNVTVAGKFSFSGAPANFALVPFQAHMDLIGTHGAASTPVELKDVEQFMPTVGAMPGIYLYEVQAGTTPIDNGQTAANLRDFGSVTVNGYSSWLNIVIDNDQSSVLNLNSLSITGTDASEFILDTAGYSNQVGSGSTTYFSLMFHPTSGGVKNATVTFGHDANNTGTPFTFEISGRGAVNGPVLKVFEDSISGTQIGHNTQVGGGRDFGQVDHLNGLVQLTIAVENQGTQDLMVGTPTLTGTGAVEFNINTTGMLNTVTPSSSTSFVIEFDPSSIGVFSAQVSFVHNDTGTTTPFVINVSGEGVILAPIIEVREMSIYGPILSPGAAAVSSRNFGIVTVGTGGGAGSAIIIHNAGWATMTLGTPVLSGTNTASFSLVLGRYTTTLAPGKFTSFTVDFDPLAKGLKTASVAFVHDDTNVVSPFTLEFIGVGDDPNGVIVASDIMLEAREGDSYSDQLQASGGTGPYTWIETSNTLNSGLTIDTDGTIHGIPVNGDGNFNTIQVMVTDAFGGTEFGFVRIRIQPPVGHLGKDPNGGSGSGCTSTEGGNVWLLGLLALMLLAYYKSWAYGQRQ